MIKTTLKKKVSVFLFFTIISLCFAHVSGAVTGDGGAVSLKHAVAALQVMSGMTPSADVSADVIGNGKIGLEDAIYVLQKVSATRKEVILSDQTRILDEDSLAMLSSVDPSDFTLTFSGESPQLSALEKGNIMVSGVHEKAPYGFMRKVESVSQNGSDIIVATSPALLKDVMLQGSVYGRTEQLGRAHIKNIVLEEGVRLDDKRSGLLGFNVGFDKSFGSGVSAYGSLYFAFGFNFELDVSFLASVDHFKASVEVEQRGVIGVKSSGNWSGTQMRLASVEFTPWTIMVGPLPLVFVPQISLMLKSEAGQVSASVETYASEEFARELGIKYDGDRWSLINEWNPPPTAEIVWPDLKGNAAFSVYCGPRTSLSLYGAAGPYVELLAYSTLEAAVSNTNYNLDFAIGLEANAGVEISAFGFELLDYSKNLFKKNIKTLTLSDQPLPGDLRITKPSGGSTLIQGRTVELEAIVSNQSPESVTFFLDGERIGAAGAPPFRIEWQVTQPTGVRTLKAEAVVNGETLSHEITVTIGIPKWITIDLGTAVNDGEELTSVFFVTGTKGWITGKKTIVDFNERYGFVIHTADGGLTWERQAVFPSTPSSNVWGYAYDILMLGPDYGFCTGDFDGGFMQTINGGRTWRHRVNFELPDSSHGWTPWPLSVYATGAKALVMHGGSSVDVSLDGGSKWFDTNSVTFSTSLGGFIRGMAFGKGERGYLFAYDYEVEGSQVFRTDNNGFLWTEVTAEEFSQFEIRSAAAFGPDMCWLAGVHKNEDKVEETDMIWYTTDGGETWRQGSTPQGDGIPEYDLRTIAFIDENRGFAAGGVYNLNIAGFTIVAGLLSTDDGGRNWKDVPVNIPGPSARINRMFFQGEFNGFAVGYSEQAESDKKQPLLLKYAITGTDD